MPSDTPLEKTDFPFAGGVSVVDGSLFRVRSRAHFLLSELGTLCGLCLHRSCGGAAVSGVSMKISSVVSGRYCGEFL